MPIIRITGGKTLGIFTENNLDASKL